VAQPVIYVETTVISYYTSRSSRDVVVAGHQAVTTDWWERDLPKFTPVISPVVLDEIGSGDAEAAAKRLAVVKGWDVLELTDEAESLAVDYFKGIALPDAARADALHLACCKEVEMSPRQRK
jgi:predicted nucleic acid-binding protein